MAGAQKIIDGGRGGSIILISSAAGIKVQPFMVHYTASKHAVTGMARAFAAELGKHSIRVNSVHPGPVNTAMGSGAMVDAVARAWRPIRSWRTRSRRFCRIGWPSPKTSPTRCAGWPATNRETSLPPSDPGRRSRFHAILIPVTAIDDLSAAVPSVADGLAAAGQHGEHHVVSAVGGGGERESQRRDQQRLRHSEAVIAPTGFAVVTGDTAIAISARWYSSTRSFSITERNSGLRLVAVK